MFLPEQCRRAVRLAMMPTTTVSGVTDVNVFPDPAVPATTVKTAMYHCVVGSCVSRRDSMQTRAFLETRAGRATRSDLENRNVVKAFRDDQDFPSSVTLHTFVNSVPSRIS